MLIYHVLADLGHTSAKTGRVMDFPQSMITCSELKSNFDFKPVSSKSVKVTAVIQSFRKGLGFI